MCDNMNLAQLQCHLRHLSLRLGRLACRRDRGLIELGTLSQSPLAPLPVTLHRCFPQMVRPLGCLLSCLTFRPGLLRMALTKVGHFIGALFPRWCLLAHGHTLFVGKTLICKGIEHFGNYYLHTFDSLNYSRQYSSRRSMNYCICIKQSNWTGQAIDCRECKQTAQ